MRKTTIALFVLLSLQSFGQSHDSTVNDVVKLMDKEKYTEALIMLNPLVANYPSVTAFRYNRAVAFFHLKKYMEAIADYKILLEDLPEPEYLFQIGNAYDHMDSLSRAIDYYSKAIDRDNENYLYYFKRGTAYLKRNIFAKAIDDFTASLQLNPVHHNSLHNRGIAFFHSKKQEQACEDWCNAYALGNSFSEEHLKKNCKSFRQKCMK